jgi:hypothetical protein
MDGIHWSRLRPLLGRGLGIGALDGDGSVDGAVLLAYELDGANVTQQRGRFADLNPFASFDVAGYLALDDKVAGFDVAYNAAIWPYRDALLLSFNGAIDLPFDDQVLVGNNLAPNVHVLADGCNSDELFQFTGSDGGGCRIGDIQ